MVDFVRMRWLIKKVPKLNFDIERAESNATISGIGYSDMPKAQSRGDRMERSVISLSDARDAYNEVINELNGMRKELIPMIDTLEDPDARAVMRLRYIHGYSPDEIADRNIALMSRASVYRWLRKSESAITMMQR